MTFLLEVYPPARTTWADTAGDCGLPSFLNFPAGMGSGRYTKNTLCGESVILRPLNRNTYGIARSSGS